MVAAGIRLTNWVAVMAELGATGGTIGPNEADALRRNLEDYRMMPATLDHPDFHFVDDGAYSSSLIVEMMRDVNP